MAAVLLFGAAVFSVLLSSASAVSCTVLQNLYSTQCLAHGDVMECNGVTLPALPSFDDCTVVVSDISFANSSIDVFQDNSLPFGLRYLEIKSSKVKTISSGAFNHCYLTLTHIDIERTDITEIPDALGKLTHIEELVLRHVDIKNWNEPVLQTIGMSVKRLDLTNNSVVAWPSWIQNFKDLTDLHFNQEGVGSIPTGALSHLTNTLKQLYVDANLSAIPPDWTALSALKRLTLANNKLTNGKNIPVQLEFLSLAKNVITELNIDSFPANSVLTELELDYNPITKVTTDAFDNLKHLRVLSMGNTLLTRVPTALAVLTHMTQIDMRDNAALVCTCEEKSLVNFFMQDPTMSIGGSCGEVTIKIFFTFVAQACP
ncbi:leucine-rich repeats and immunoglobulin-like domains protein 2 [Physella acuta]|uniref:leucine-rich repeats and immunoglobulin-like domains protein 2 n=1 Tax=Physella acuta TaxID=109671 RepID=UPI0027DE2908|nr:leucine-rich repeats and immunoglobulin-like domains protein 2 [Physella acuta]